MVRAAGDPQLRLWMVLDLGELGSPKALPYLTGLSRDPHPLIRHAAAQALVRIGAPARATLRAALGHGTARAQPYVMAALGAWGSQPMSRACSRPRSRQAAPLASAARDSVQIIRSFARYRGADARFQSRPAGIRPRIPAPGGFAPSRVDPTFSTRTI